MKTLTRKEFLRMINESKSGYELIGRIEYTLQKVVKDEEIELAIKNLIKRENENK